MADTEEVHLDEDSPEIGGEHGIGVPKDLPASLKKRWNAIVSALLRLCSTTSQPNWEAYYQRLQKLTNDAGKKPRDTPELRAYPLALVCYLPAQANMPMKYQVVGLEENGIDAAAQEPIKAVIPLVQRALVSALDAAQVGPYLWS